MKLVIAEKPSVSMSLAKVIGANKRGDGYLEGGGYLVSWCVGHLVELSEPEAYNEEYSKWRLKDLPILPENWEYIISDSTKKQFYVLKELMLREDVESLICATDAGREGELIFRLVYNQAGCTKPFERLWISSMEDSAIREGFENLQPSIKYDALYEAALCRERADWIVGINATRLFSCLYNRTLSIGRVMTPTLAMVVKRDEEIAAFKPKLFYTVQITVNGAGASSRRFDTKEEAERLLEDCRRSMRATVKSIDNNERSEHSPLLYDLTGLQRDANRILGFTAKQTLDYAQALYEKKLITYPRTDSCYLTEDMQEKLPQLIGSVCEKLGIRDLKGDSAVPFEGSIKKVFNNAKVSDHHAIIPTKAMNDAELSAIPEGEMEILRLISVRLICAAADDYRFKEETVLFNCADEEFKWKNRTVVSGGWKSIWQKFYPGREKQDMIYTGSSLVNGAAVDIAECGLETGETTPPKRFTEDLLLKAMQTAGADEIPEDAERKGIGTPATRAGIIEKLVKKGFIERRGGKKARSLFATEKGNALITVMPETLRSASMTAEWEQRLLEIERGSCSPEDFMKEISRMITGLIENYDAAKETTKETVKKLSDYKRVGNCPCCHSDVYEKQKGWFCSNKDCKFVLWKDNTFFRSIGKKLSTGMVEKLLKYERIALSGCVSRRTNRFFDANILLSTEESGKPIFSMDFDTVRKRKTRRNGGIR